MRQLVIISHPIDTIVPQEKGGIILPDRRVIPFYNAKTLLGSEFAYAIYDMCAEGGICFNLEALAIVAGTIQDGGNLYLLCPQWHGLENQLDFDALRWHANQPLICPHFYRYFKQQVAECHIPILDHLPELPITRNEATQKPFLLTDEQQNILDNLPIDTADIHLITAARGRGKSTIAAKLAEKIAQTHSVIITARSLSALPHCWKGLPSNNIHYVAPDTVKQQAENRQISANQWLFVDEAASLPLPTLQYFCGYFNKVILTTTTHNYEGTGRGFSLKLPAQITRSTQQWQLTQPQRWGQNDRLEHFIHRLLLLDEPNPLPLVSQKQTNSPIPFLTLKKEKCGTVPFYHLLAQAHYKTTPTDLRRLFDAPQQRFYHFEQHQHPIAACWAIEEGGLENDLIEAIWRGERRPAGNLVAQYLCFQGNLKASCQLRSLRLSRLAVQPALQRKGIGKRLVQSIILQIEREIDFVSVSFGMSRELFAFWLECGFTLVQITPQREASSGYHSAMMLYPTSLAGKAFIAQAKAQFERDLPLQPFFAALPEDVQKKAIISPLAAEFCLDDQQNLQGFIYAQRPFSACFVSLKRLYLRQPTHFSLLQQLFEEFHGELPTNKKAWIAALREQLRFSMM